MKKFAFPLERVLAFRREQVQLEELKLEKIFDDRRRLMRKDALLRAAERQSTTTVMAKTVLEPSELSALSSFRNWTERQCLALAEQAADCDRRAAEQRALLNEARQRVRLVEKLRERRLAEWQSGFDKEVEDLAAESFLSRWNRERALLRTDPVSSDPEFERGPGEPFT